MIWAVDGWAEVEHRIPRVVLGWTCGCPYIVSTIPARPVGTKEEGEAISRDALVNIVIRSVDWRPKICGFTEGKIRLCASVAKHHSGQKSDEHHSHSVSIQPFHFTPFLSALLPKGLAKIVDNRQ
jgi:hypothetical protein